MGLGVPKLVELYEKVFIDDVAVYLPKGFESPYELTIDVNSLFGFKTLNLEGWKLV